MTRAIDIAYLFKSEIILTTLNLDQLAVKHIL